LWEKEDDFNQCLNWAVPEPFTLFEIFTLRKYLAKKTTGHLSVFAAYLGAILERSALFCTKQINQLRLFFALRRNRLLQLAFEAICKWEVSIMLWFMMAMHYAKMPVFMMRAKLTNFRDSGGFNEALRLVLLMMHL
jgi:hypothetical protein